MPFSSPDSPLLFPKKRVYLSGPLTRPTSQYKIKKKKSKKRKKRK